MQNSIKDRPAAALPPEAQHQPVYGISSFFLLFSFKKILCCKINKIIFCQIGSSPLNSDPYVGACKLFFDIFLFYSFLLIFIKFLKNSFFIDTSEEPGQCKWFYFIGYCDL